MTQVTYSPLSPYSNTPQVNIVLEYLDFWKGFYVVPTSRDYAYVVQSKYDKRPDLLSNDLYGTPRWWWVFALRNQNILKDPIFDLKTGITIMIPDKSALPQGAQQ